MLDDEVVRWIRDAVNGAGSWEDVRASLAAHDPDGNDVRLRPFVFAYGYALHERSTGARERAGSPYGAMLAGEGWRFPPAIEDVEATDVQQWREALDAIDHPIVHARLGDLLWERKHRPDPHLRAQHACDALVVISRDKRWREMDRIRCASRALELARETQDKGRGSVAVEALLTLAMEDIESDSGGPGVAVGALQPLVALPKDARPEGLDECLVRVGEAYAGHPFAVDSIIELRSQLISAKARLELRREQVQRWRAEAAQADGILRVYRLEQALDLARKHGLQEETTQLRSELSGIGPEELALKAVGAEIKLPEGEVERFLSMFDDAASALDALRLLAAQPPPGGTPEELERYVEELMEAHPLQYIFGKALIGPDNATPIFRAATPAEHRRLELAAQRAARSRMWGAFCAEALHRIGQRPDRPDRQALAQFIASSVIDAETAERVARSIELFWENAPDESAHLLIPRLERIIREFARQLGVPIVQEPRPEREIGGVETLGVLLRNLKSAFADRAWHAYLMNLLADPLGMNLRNLIAHGLHGTVGSADASLLVQVALRLSMLQIQRVDNPPAPPPGAAPTA
jgi:hypothetical protein